MRSYKRTYPMKKSILSLIFSGVLAAGAATSVNASDESSHHGGIDHAKHPHHFSILVGDTHISGHGDGFTVGLDYEYRLNDLLGIGTVIEYAAGDLEAWTFLAVADIHITPQWIVQVGPGHERTSKHNLFVARLGTLYEFEFEGGWTIAPQVHFDYHEDDDNAIVWGLAVGKSF